MEEIRNIGNVPFKYVNGKGKLSGWNLVLLETPLDGNCLIHAILGACNKVYIMGKIVNEEGVVRGISRNEFARRIRYKIAEKLREVDQDGTMYYDKLSNNYQKEFAKDVVEFSLENMEKTLKSNDYLGFGYIELLADFFEIDIYLIYLKENDIYPTPELKYSIKGRDSVVITYDDEKLHYETCGIIRNDSIHTYFKSTNNFVAFLKNRVIELLST